MKKIWKLSAFLVVVLLAGCVTQKKKGAEPGWFKKGYHNLTSKYNYWFNADELFRLTEDKLADQHKDNYNQILDIYPSAATDPQSALGDLDNVVVKASKGIGLHRVSDWADDCYTLIGQSQFLKRDYETAESTFRYIKDEYDPKKKNKSKLKVAKKKKDSGKKKKKKKKTSRRKKKKAAKKRHKEALRKKKEAAKNKAAGKTGTTTTVKPAEIPKAEIEEVKLTSDNPYTKGIKRTSAYPTAMVWYGRTLIERDKYDEAEFLFRDLWDDRFFPESLYDELYTAEAYLWMKQKRYDKAIEPLSKAIERTQKKQTRARLAYILAQLYERAGQSEGAYAALETVLNSAPSYEMEFNARLHQIEAGWTNAKLSSADANKSLERMLKDDKNLEYRDQIYYTMASIALKDGLKPDAIGYLRQSLDYNQGNTVQRAESYLKLANLYFETESFVQAKNYFDSTLTVLPATDERYKTVSDYATNLKDIARLIQNIAANDSIVRIYRMSDEERKEFGKKLKKQKQEEAEAALRAEASKITAPSPTRAPTPVAGGKASTFYFYNESFLKKGRKDFTRAWGERKLEDNWRRKNRPITSLPSDDLVTNDSIQKNTVSEAELTDMFKNIPTSEAELSVLHLATYEAMYQLGTLFRDRLQNNQRSTGTLEEMQTRYPETDRYEKETWYYCYLGFTDLKNPTRAQFYLDKLVAKYPNSSYARALTDPNFRNSNKEKEDELNKYYEQTYNTFSSGNYKDAFELCVDAPKKYGSQNPLMAKFSLLSALCIGNLQGNEAYCKALTEVIARYPDSPESTRAKEIARVISCKGFEVAEAPKKTDKTNLDEGFTLEDDKLHYFLVAITGDVRVDDIKASISDYNRENHKLEQLRISNIFLGTDTNQPIIVIRKFDTKEQAMRFYAEVSKQKSFMGESDKKTYNKEFFAITQENYRRVLKNKSLDGYKTFFQDNYLK